MNHPTSKHISGGLEDSLVQTIDEQLPICFSTDKISCRKCKTGNIKTSRIRQNVHLFSLANILNDQEFQGFKDESHQRTKRDAYPQTKSLVSTTRSLLQRQSSTTLQRQCPTMIGRGWMFRCGPGPSWRSRTPSRRRRASGARRPPPRRPGGRRPRRVTRPPESTRASSGSGRAATGRR